MQDEEAKPFVRFAVMPPIMGLQRPPLPLPLPGVQLLLLPLLLVIVLEVVTILEAKTAKETALETGGGDSWVREGVDEIIDDMPLSLLQMTEDPVTMVPGTDDIPEQLLLTTADALT